MALLVAEKIDDPKKYADFLDVFFKKSAAMLFNYLDINKYVINVKPNSSHFIDQSIVWVQ